MSTNLNQNVTVSQFLKNRPLGRARMGSPARTVPGSAESPAGKLLENSVTTPTANGLPAALFPAKQKGNRESEKFITLFSVGVSRHRISAQFLISCPVSQPIR